MNINDKKSIEFMVGYLKKLQLSCHNLIMDLPASDSPALNNLSPEISYSDIQAICLLAGRIQSKAGAIENEYRLILDRNKKLRGGAD